MIYTRATYNVSDDTSGVASSDMYNYHHCRETSNQCCSNFSGCSSYTSFKSTDIKLSSYAQAHHKKSKGEVYYYIYTSYIQYTYWKFCDNAGNCRYVNYKLNVKSDSCSASLVGEVTG